MTAPPFQAIVFDLYSGLLNSWALWNTVAGSDAAGLRWRKNYLELTYQTGAYRPYEDLIREAAEASGLPLLYADELLGRWADLEPWPETPAILSALLEKVPVAVATNSSVALARIAVARTGVNIPVVVTAEEVGFYKPLPHPYRTAMAHLGCPPESTLFVAGSPSDVPGASGVGMPVYWHNRLGLPTDQRATIPRYVENTLTPLLDLI